MHIVTNSTDVTRRKQKSKVRIIWEELASLVCSTLSPKRG